eukprot:TRINITY_DN583_c0_g1_i1.p1 TRINITY_DN583_c0_g1~~TRINITY_DN583_c0_g1_i1.p1  ORF type:complete len:291 (-),score=77.48 TRINITY_DN583_c0_g1_i1:196-1068(-)
MSRPEHLAPPEIFYSETEAKKYSTNTRMIEIQTRMSERALELLNLPEERACFLLDVGCGSGLSGEVLTENGHEWVGVDISTNMLDVAIDRGTDGDVMALDMGGGLPFRPGVFDGAISISALQWLCNADKSHHVPAKRLRVFFQSLYNCLGRGARAVFQFYPENPDQMELITSMAMKCGFTGGLVVDYPNSTKAKKYFLCLFAGVPQDSEFQLPKGLSEEDGLDDDEDSEEGEKQAKFLKANKRRADERKGKGRRSIKDRDWVLAKKERQRRQGKDVRPDSKYSGRSRRRF